MANFIRDFTLKWNILYAHYSCLLKFSSNLLVMLSTHAHTYKSVNEKSRFWIEFQYNYKISFWQIIHYFAMQICWYEWAMRVYYWLWFAKESNQPQIWMSLIKFRYEITKIYEISFRMVSHFQNVKSLKFLLSNEKSEISNLLAVFRSFNVAVRGQCERYTSNTL